MVIRRRYRVTVNGKTYEVEVEEEGEGALRVRAEEVSYGKLKGAILSPVPGKVVKLRVGVGDKVSKDDLIAVIESMKALVEVKSPYEGVVREVKVKEGDFVNINQVIVIIN